MGTLTCRYADDSERLILEYFDAIHDSPSHIYHSALPLSPSSSWIRECYRAEVAGEVKVLVGLPGQWDTCSRTIHFGGKINAFAHRGNIIAIGLASNVVLLDAITGRRTSVLSGHKRTIRSLEFSLDATLLLSRSADGAVSIWDVQTGGVIRTLNDGTSTILTFSISPDGTTIALGARNGAIRLWDVRTGRSHSIETRRHDPVLLIRFSPIDSQRFLSLLGNKTVQQWDVDGHQIGSSHREAFPLSDLAYASDGSRFVVCGGRHVKVRDSESGFLVVKIYIPDHSEPTSTRCRLSPDGRLVFCTAGFSILVWDITIPGARLVGQLAGHTNLIHLLAFSSSSLISVSADQTVKFWQTSSLLVVSTATDQVVKPVPIQSVKLFAEDGIIVTNHWDGAVKTWDLTTGKLKSSFSTPAQGTRDTHLAGDALTIVWCEGGDCHVWDVYREQLLLKFPFFKSDLLSLKISGDGSRIFGLGEDGIQAVSMQTGEDMGRVDLAGRYWGFSVDGFKVEIENSGGRRGWDFGGPKVSEIGEFSTQHRLGVLGWSPGFVASPCWIEDTVTGRLVFRFPAERYMKDGTEIEWHGRYLLVWTPYPRRWSRSAAGLVIMDFDPVWPQ